MVSQIALTTLIYCDLVLQVLCLSPVLSFERQPTIQDLHQLSPSTARSLESLLKYDGDDFESTFCLNFEITRQRFDQTINVELIPGGSNTPVTKENVKQYVNAYIEFILNKSVEHAFTAFNSGFHHVCGSKVLELFHPSELMAMVIGNQNYDFEEFEKTAEYKGDYSAEHPVIINFWQVFHALTVDEKKKFLTFLTGTDRIPILGMKRVKVRSRTPRLLILSQPLAVYTQRLKFPLCEIPNYTFDMFVCLSVCDIYINYHKISINFIFIIYLA